MVFAADYAKMDAAGTALDLAAIVSRRRIAIVSMAYFERLAAREAYDLIVLAIHPWKDVCRPVAGYAVDLRWHDQTRGGGET